MRRKCPRCNSLRIMTDTPLNIAENYRIGKIVYGIYCLNCAGEFDNDYVILWWMASEIEEELCASAQVV